MLEKHENSSFFLQKSPFSSLKSVPLGDVTLQKRVTDLHQRFPMKKRAISKFPRTMIHLGDIAGPRGCIFATQFLHVQTSLRPAVWTISFVRSCSLCPPNFTPRGRLHEKWELTNPDTPFHIPFALVEYGLSLIGTSLTWFKKLKIAANTC